MELKIGKRSSGEVKLKDGLILREVAGQYVIVPVEHRVQDVTGIVYISSSAAYLWDYMKDHEFEKEDLVKRIMEHFTGVSQEQASADIERFLSVLAEYNILDDGIIRGQSTVRFSKKLLDKMWPSNGPILKRQGEDKNR